MKKEKFSSKRGFVLASVGAAVGLGNALRFPGLCAKYGGGTYMLIYFCALIILGIPLLNAELALGRKVGGGTPKCLESLRPGAGKLGWAACANSAVTALIYAGLAGWILAMAVKIFPLAAAAQNMPQQEISGYFFKNVLKASYDGVISSVSPLICGGIAVVLIAMALCLKGGANALSKAAKFTVTVPIILLTFMAARGLFYPNSALALKQLFVPRLSALAEPDLWLSALGQVFFSLSVAVGIMPAYGACLPEGTNIFSCTLIIAAADFAVSLLSSVVLFTTFYGCGLQAEIGQSGIVTAFAVYPVAICSLFGNNAALNGIVGGLFYFSLSLIALQAAASMAEAFLSPLAQTFNVKKSRLAPAFCAIGAVICLIFATSAAIVVVDVADRFINFYNVILLCVAECFIIAKSRTYDEICDEINKFSKRLKMPKKPFAASVKFLSPAVLSSLAVYEVFSVVKGGLSCPAWAACGFGWGLSLLIFFAAILIERLARAREPRPRKKRFKIFKRT